MDRATSPEARRAGLARMKDTLVLARVGLDDMRGGVAVTRGRLVKEEQELETMRRRKGLAAGIDDAETVALAQKYETHHAERAAVLRRKLDAQEAELAIAERDVEEMTMELRNALAGISGAAGTDFAGAAEPMGDRTAGDPGTLGTAGTSAPREREREDVASELDAMARARARGARDADAEARLAELKRRMGK